MGSKLLETSGASPRWLGPFSFQIKELLWGTGISTRVTSVAVTTDDVAHIDSDDTSRVIGK